MAHNEDLDKIKQKIRSLMNMTVERGASLAEAEMAMKQVGKLLLQYSLSMDMVDVAKENCITVVCGAGTLKRSLHSTYSSAIATFCGVRHWMFKSDKEMNFVFFGFEPDVQMAAYLFSLIDGSIKFETNAYKRTPQYVCASVHRKRLSNSFQNGMARGLANRLYALAAEQTRGQQTLSGSTALVVVAKEQRVEVEFEKMGMKLRKVPHSSRISERESALAGRAAADKVNLSRPLGGKAELAIK
jgi:hypothetical protein